MDIVDIALLDVVELGFHTFDIAGKIVDIEHHTQHIVGFVPFRILLPLKVHGFQIFISFHIEPVKIITKLSVHGIIAVHFHVKPAELIISLLHSVIEFFIYRCSGCFGSRFRCLFGCLCRSFLGCRSRFSNRLRCFLRCRLLCGGFLRRRFGFRCGRLVRCGFFHRRLFSCYWFFRGSCHFFCSRFNFRLYCRGRCRLSFSCRRLNFRFCRRGRCCLSFGCRFFSFRLDCRCLSHRCSCRCLSCGRFGCCFACRGRCRCRRCRCRGCYFLFTAFLFACIRTFHCYLPFYFKC